MNSLNLLNFNIITTELKTTLEQLIKKTKIKLEHILNSSINTNTIQNIDIFDQELDIFWLTISHLNAVNNSKELRQAYNECLNIMINYYNFVNQNVKLQQVLKKIYHSADKQVKYLIENINLTFKLEGGELNATQKQLFNKINQQLAALEAKFEQNVLDATMQWQFHIKDESIAINWPETRKKIAAKLANEQQKNGYI